MTSGGGARAEWLAWSKFVIFRLAGLVGRRREWRGRGGNTALFKIATLKIDRLFGQVALPVHIGIDA